MRLPSAICASSAAAPAARHRAAPRSAAPASTFTPAPAGRGIGPGARVGRRAAALRVRRASRSFRSKRTPPTDVAPDPTADAEHSPTRVDVVDAHLDRIARHVSAQRLPAVGVVELRLQVVGDGADRVCAEVQPLQLRHDGGHRGGVGRCASFGSFARDSARIVTQARSGALFTSASPVVTITGPSGACAACVWDCREAARPGATRNGSRAVVGRKRSGCRQTPPTVSAGYLTGQAMRKPMPYE